MHKSKKGFAKQISQGFFSTEKKAFEMHYSVVLKRNGKEVAREQGEEKLEELAKKLDSIVVKMK